MPNIGLWTRLCPKCQVIEAHRTLYIKTESHGKSKWHRIFWVCTACGSLNHVTMPVCRLEYVPLELPSPLVACVVEALKQGPKDVDELVRALKGNCPGVRHIFTSEVRLALEYLERLGAASEQPDDRTERTLEELRARRATSSHLGLCPAEAEKGIEAKGLVSVYAQRRQKVNRGDEPTNTGKLRLAPVGVLCVACGYNRIDSALLASR